MSGLRWRTELGAGLPVSVRSVLPPGEAWGKRRRGRLELLSGRALRFVRSRAHAGPAATAGSTRNIVCYGVLKRGRPVRRHDLTWRSIQVLLR